MLNTNLNEQKHIDKVIFTALRELIKERENIIN